jgi:uncharacterized membrane protein YfcA
MADAVSTEDGYFELEDFKHRSSAANRAAHTSSHSNPTHTPTPHTTHHPTHPTPPTTHHNTTPTSTPPTPTTTYILRNKSWVQFVPAFIVWPIWLFVMMRGNYWSAVFVYWPGTLGMTLGSFIAGATPLGGGVVAFPLAVLVFNLTSAESRDVSVLVQAVGMNGAAYLLYISKPELLHAQSIVVNTIFGSIGVLFALAYPASPYVVSMLYTLLVLEFAIVYFYTNMFVRGREEGSKDSVLRSPPASSQFMHATMAVAAIAGGFLTGNMGSVVTLLYMLTEFMSGIGSSRTRQKVTMPSQLRRWL